MAQAPPNSAALKVFISYSRADMEFADEIVAGLEFDGEFETTIDRESIIEGEDWKKRLGALIANADTIVFILSPDSAASSVCAWEVSEAQRLSKRILPVLVRPLGEVPAPPALAALNYVRFDDNRSFMAGLRALVTSLKTDVAWLREHTRLLTRAQEWDRAGRPETRLLVGDLIAEAKIWARNRPHDAPELTELHAAFLHASEEAERARESEERKRAEEFRLNAVRAQRNARRATWGLVGALVFAVGAGIAGTIAYIQAQEADGQRKEAVRQRQAAQKQENEADRQRELAEAEAQRARKNAEAADRARKVAEAAQQAQKKTLRDLTARSKQLWQYFGEIQRSKRADAYDSFTGAFGGPDAAQRMLADVDDEKPKIALSDDALYKKMAIPISDASLTACNNNDSLVTAGRKLLQRAPFVSAFQAEQFRAVAATIASLGSAAPTELKYINALAKNDKRALVPEQLRALAWSTNSIDALETTLAGKEAAAVFQLSLEAQRAKNEIVVPSYPFADTRFRLHPRGKFKDGYPRGAVVHFAAGRSSRDFLDAEATIRYSVERRLGYHFAISTSGRVYQLVDLDRWGTHAGRSAYPGLGSNVSSSLVGIELTNAGVVSKANGEFAPWWSSQISDENRKTILTDNEVRRVAQRDNIQSAGYYMKFTRAQEVSLTNLILWLERQRPDVFSFDFVVGHDEVSQGRKNDPGGALSITMPEYRGFLKRIKDGGFTAVDGNFFTEWRSGPWACK